MSSAKAENVVDSDESSSSESGDDDDDMDVTNDTLGEVVSAEEIETLKSQLTENPFQYDAHIKLIGALRSNGELEAMRGAREEFAKRFPLSPQLWLEWIKDEIDLQATTSETDEQGRVLRLFERAVVDYTSLDVWLEYCQWACGGLQGFEAVREVFERAITAVGLDCAKGVLLWDAYRVFEAALCQLYAGAADADSADKLQKQRQRVEKLYRRQFSIPLIGMRKTWDEFKEFLEGKPVDEALKKVFDSTVRRVSKLQTLEDLIELAPEPALHEYNTYIDYEIKGKDPARIQLIFERALVKNCLDQDLWIKYLTWLDEELKTSQVSLLNYARAVRNCPWSCQLWRRYLTALERADNDNTEWTKIDSVFAQAKENFSSAADAVKLWLDYIYMLKRRCDVEKKDYACVQAEFQSASEQLIGLFSEYDWDADSEFRRSWAHLEAYKCDNLDKARAIWLDIMHTGMGRFADRWLEWLSLERNKAGAIEDCRKLLYKAVNSASDYPERVCDALVQFEREEGSFADVEKARKRVDEQLGRVKERLAKQQYQKQQQELKSHKKPLFAGKRGAESQKPAKSKPSRASKPAASPSDEKDTVKRKLADDRRDEDTPDEQPTVKRVKPGENGVGSASVSGEQQRQPAEATKLVDQQGFTVPTLPVLHNKPKTNTQNPANHQKAETSGGTAPSEEDEKLARTVFVSNLDFALKEDVLYDIFSKLGEVAEVRLARKFGRLSKGYGYVEFTDKSPVEEALKQDRYKIEGRPMYVSRCEVRKKKSNEANEPALGSATTEPAGGFRFAQSMEKNKLFVKNLQYSVTEKDLEELFKPYGQLRSARLVVHKSGKSKGLAYIEFVEDSSAQRALLSTDNTVFHGRPISVAISDPPARKAPGSAPTQFAPYLGGGSGTPNVSEVGRKGSSKLQMGIMKPRAVASGGGTTKTSESVMTKKPESALKADVFPVIKEPLPTPVQTVDSISGTSGKAKLSNEQFRNMFLKKS